MNFKYAMAFVKLKETFKCEQLLQGKLMVNKMDEF